VTKSKENEVNEEYESQRGRKSELSVYIGKENERIHLGELHVDGKLVFK
jgi:hypothetical protein